MKKLAILCVLLCGAAVCAQDTHDKKFELGPYTMPWTLNNISGPIITCDTTMHNCKLEQGHNLDEVMQAYADMSKLNTDQQRDLEAAYGRMARRYFHCAGVIKAKP